MSDPEILICQYCGRSTPAESDDAVHWLSRQSRWTEGIWIIRCPEHISEWAMRQSVGRTIEWREKARWGREVWASQPYVNPFVSPLPADFIGAAESASETAEAEIQVPETGTALAGPPRPVEGRFRGI